MKKFLFLTSFLSLALASYAQRKNFKVDAMVGLHKPVGTLDIENRFGGRLGAGLRLSNNKSSFTLLQFNYDFFKESADDGLSPHVENSGAASIYSFLAGYSRRVWAIDPATANIKFHIGLNAGAGLVGHNRMDRTPKFALNPVLSVEPFREVYVDVGFLNFWGGTSNTGYFNFNIRCSFFGWD